jgi:hypothetical protein
LGKESLESPEELKPRESVDIEKHTKLKKKRAGPERGLSEESLDKLPQGPV